MGYLKIALVALVDSKPRKWDKYLSSVLFAYRAAIHPDIMDTPFFINKGYDPRLPELVAVNAPRDDLEQGCNWADELAKIHLSLQEKIAKQQHEIRRKLEEQGDDVYSIGQVVLLKKTKYEQQQDHTKITDRYHHPARIMEVMPNGVTYRVKLIGHGDEKSSPVQIVNRRHMRPLYESSGEDNDPVTVVPRFPLAEVNI